MYGVVAVNDEQFERVARKVASVVDLAGATVAMWGLAFKAGTDDVRESPALEVARRLISAGATVQGSYLVRGAPEGNQIMMAPGHEVGFGFLPDSAIDQHAIVRNRLDDMIPVIKRHPHLLGVAIDESTALIVSSGVATVLGKSKVALYDAKRWKDGSPKYFFLEKGERFDVKARRKLN